eukprot:TRINITY_DN13787_c0_g1_i1.p1 TRINITY_DN13787_c0_g1~~TRINITY_DN13787_c0_g1_i1.p1  ORF type:complete len:281 (-),score=26.84 TRINITY_DN13787_c0_g1_i1:18-860(-)
MGEGCPRVVLSTLVGALFVYLSLWIGAFLPLDITDDLLPIDNHISLEKMLLIFFIHVLFVLLISSYLLAACRDPGYVEIPEHGSIEERRCNRLENDHGSSEERQQRFNTAWNTDQYCFICELERPTDSHHCKHCNRCVEGMDHHCYFVENCIGKNNFKAFLLLLIYGFITSVICLIIFGLGALKGIVRIKELGIKEGIELAMCVLSGLSLLYFCILSLMIGIPTFQLVLRGETHVSVLKKELRKEPVDTLFDGENTETLGYVDNLAKVMGKKKMLWFVPC